ncbi:hypothetical protein [Amycolatopsis lurida]|uniref:hypothetical protein n=1 Tax=Amycolatopsis lurida TaxID=31959 RepID=UPI00116004F4|nr:hypothetical protein [Amycolatopsis lurida]
MDERTLSVGTSTDERAWSANQRTDDWRFPFDHGGDRYARNMASDARVDEKGVVPPEVPPTEPTPIYDELTAAVIELKDELPSATLR